MFTALDSQTIKPTSLSASSRNLLEGGALPTQEPHWLVIQTPENSENKPTDPLVENSDSDLDLNNNTEDEDEIPLMVLAERIKCRSSIAGGMIVNVFNSADSERAQELLGNPWNVELERVSETQRRLDQESCQEREASVERGRPLLKLGERVWPMEVRSRYRGRRESKGGRDKGADESMSPRQIKTMRSAMQLEASNIPALVGSSGSLSITSCPKVMGIQQHASRIPRPVHDNDCLMGDAQYKLQALPGQDRRQERPKMSLYRSNLVRQTTRFPANEYLTWVPYLPNCGSVAGFATQSVRDGPWKAIRAHMESIPAFPEPKLLDIREAIILDRQRRMPWLYKDGNRPATEFPDVWGRKTYRR